jgi:Fe-S oxidoreductase
MKHNLEAIRKSGTTEIITSCAECYYMFKVIYPKLLERNDIGVKVTHTSELIAELIGNGKLKLKKKAQLRTTYHDPCHLGRLGEPYIHWKGKLLKYGRHDPPKVYRRGTNGIYSPPREVLKSVPGLQLVEME